MIETNLSEYLDALRSAIDRTETTFYGKPLDPHAGMRRLLDEIRAARERGSRLWWMGNGGSAAIASHEANDFMKNGNCRSLDFSSVSHMTCLSNDYGYPHVFEEMIRRNADPRDIAVFISSSGNSPNVVLGAEEARRKGCLVVAMTGFKPDNALRALGDLSFYVPSMEYGYVELAHQVLCHAVLDFLYKEDNEAKAKAEAPRVAETPKT